MADKKKRRRVLASRDEPEDAAENPVEQAMIAAIEQCHADGVTDPDKVSKAIKEAKDKALKARREAATSNGG